MDNFHILHWFEFAEDDLDSAKILVEHGSRKINAVCFHSHQSAEKNLKGYLVANDIVALPKIHDLRELCLLCANFDKSFETLIPICNNLNPYGVRVKYPDEIVIDEQEAKQSIADAQAIQAFEPIAVVRTAIETEYKKQHFVTEATVIVGAGSE
jgi:HEPN domain-containing protein